MTSSTCFLYILLLCSFQTAFAYPEGSLGDVAHSVTLSFENLARLITAIAYVAGMGFSIGSIMKFKAHKDNPTQVPVGTPIALIFIAASLIFLPTIFKMVGNTLFGQDLPQIVGGTGGLSTFGLNT